MSDDEYSTKFQVNMPVQKWVMRHSSAVKSCKILYIVAQPSGGECNTNIGTEHLLVGLLTFLKLWNWMQITAVVEHKSKKCHSFLTRGTLKNTRSRQLLRYTCDKNSMSARSPMLEKVGLEESKTSLRQWNRKWFTLCL